MMQTRSIDIETACDYLEETQETRRFIHGDFLVTMGVSAAGAKFLLIDNARGDLTLHESM